MVGKEGRKEGRPGRLRWKEGRSDMENSSAWRRSEFKGDLTATSYKGTDKTTFLPSPFKQPETEFGEIYRNLEFFLTGLTSWKNHKIDSGDGKYSNKI
jgi:hypothetical protein